MLDREKDRFIKAQLQKDKLISKKADDVINNFLKEGYNMEEKNQAQNNKQQENIIQKKSPWKKILATAACLVVVFGGANAYAHTQGYGNIFFMIKYLITGQNDYVEGKENILSDRDITISYQPINLTENVSLIVKKLQIKDGNAKLILMESQKQPNDTNLPLKYEVTDDSNAKLGEAESEISGNNVNSQKELQLNNFKENTKIINLKVSSKNNNLIANLKIDIENKTVEVAGEQEALQKISEIELKEFLGYAAGLSKENNQVNLARTSYDSTSILGVAIDLSYDKVTKTKINGVDSLLASDVNEAIESILDIKAAELDMSTVDYYKKITNNGTDYYQFNVAGDVLFRGECIDVSNISFCNGIYTVTYSYWFPPDDPEADINQFEIFEQTISLKLNENAKYSKFKIMTTEEPIIIQDPENRIEEEPQPSPTTTSMPTATPTATSTPTATAQPTAIDNYATSMSWTNYWAPGLKFQYPTTFSISNIPDIWSDEPTTFVGTATGKNPETGERIDSKMKIQVQQPRFESNENILHNYMYDEQGYERAHITTNNGIVWYESVAQSDDLEYDRSDCYVHIEENTDGSKYVIQMEFFTTNSNNYKIINIENWMIGSTQLTSW